MAKRGRPPKPLALRRLNGNAGKRKLPEQDTAPLAPGAPDPAQLAAGVASLRVPAPPKHLSRDAANEWRRLASQLVHRGLLRSLDLTVFEIRCETYSRWLKAKKELQRSLVYTVNGMRRKKPEIQIVSDCEQRMRLFDSEYGLTPAARARVAHVTGADQPSLPLPEANPTAKPPADNSAPAAPEAPRPDPGTMSDDAYFGGPKPPVH